MSAANNTKLWPKYQSQLGQKGDPFKSASNILARWMVDSRAFYPDARPQILNLFKIAQNTLSSPNGPEFTYRECPPTLQEYGDAYRKMVQQAWQHKERFTEPELLETLTQLYPTTLTEREFQEFQQHRNTRSPSYNSVTPTILPHTTTDKIGPPSRSARHQNKRSTSSIGRSNAGTSKSPHVRTSQPTVSTSRIESKAAEHPHSPLRSPSAEEVPPSQTSSSNPTANPSANGKAPVIRRVILKLGVPPSQKPNPSPTTASVSSPHPLSAPRPHHIHASNEKAVRQLPGTGHDEPTIARDAQNGVPSMHAVTPIAIHARHDAQNSPHHGDASLDHAADRMHEISPSSLDMAMEAAQLDRKQSDGQITNDYSAPIPEGWAMSAPITTDIDPIAPRVMGTSAKLSDGGDQITRADMFLTSMTVPKGPSHSSSPLSDGVEKQPSPSPVPPPPFSQVPAKTAVPVYPDSSSLVATPIAAVSPLLGAQEPNLMTPLQPLFPSAPSLLNGSTLTAPQSVVPGASPSQMAPPTAAPKKIATLRKKKATKLSTDFMDVDLKAHQAKRARESLRTPPIPSLAAAPDSGERSMSMSMSPTISGSVVGPMEARPSAPRTMSPVPMTPITPQYPDNNQALPPGISKPNFHANGANSKETTPIPVVPAGSSNSSRSSASPGPSRLDALRRTQAAWAKAASPSSSNVLGHQSGSPLREQSAPPAPFASHPPVKDAAIIILHSPARVATPQQNLSDKLKSLNISSQAVPTTPQGATPDADAPAQPTSLQGIPEITPIVRAPNLPHGNRVQSASDGMQINELGAIPEKSRSQLTGQPPEHLQATGIHQPGPPSPAMNTFNNSLQSVINAAERSLVRPRSPSEDPEQQQPKKRRKKKILQPAMVSDTDDADGIGSDASGSDVPLSQATFKQKRPNSAGRESTSQVTARSRVASSNSNPKHLTPHSSGSRNIEIESGAEVPHPTNRVLDLATPPGAVQPASKIGLGISGLPIREVHAPVPLPPPTSSPPLEEQDPALGSLVNAFHYPTEDYGIQEELTDLEPSSGLASFKRGLSYPNAKLRFIIQVDQAIWEKHLCWIERQAKPSDLTSSLCISLESYERASCPAYMMTDGEVENEEGQLPAHRWPVDAPQARVWAGGVDPARIDLSPFWLSEDGRFDLTPYCKPGEVRLEILNPAPANDFIFVVRIHRPTLQQLDALRKSKGPWDKLVSEPLQSEGNPGDAWAAVDRRMRTMSNHA